MDECERIINGLIGLEKKDDQIKAGILIGSRARTDRPADEYSDVDIILLVEDIDFFIQTDEWLKDLGKYHISFVENTVAGGKERRVLFDQAMDADFLFLRAGNVGRIEKDASVQDIVSRSYRILFDKIGFGTVLRNMASAKEIYMPPSETGFTNIICNFWFHSVWAAKKALRGELWVAKNCVDGYMKSLLLQMTEIHAHAVHGREYDTWHNGRFLEKWAEPWIIERLPGIFSDYSVQGILSALVCTMDLFRQLTTEAAELLNYQYPNEQAEYAASYLKSVMRP